MGIFLVKKTFHPQKQGGRREGNISFSGEKNMASWCFPWEQYLKKGAGTRMEVFFSIIPSPKNYWGKGFGWESFRYLGPLFFFFFLKFKKGKKTKKGGAPIVKKGEGSNRAEKTSNSKPNKTPKTQRQRPFEGPKKMLFLKKNPPNYWKNPLFRSGWFSPIFWARMEKKGKRTIFLRG